MKTELYFGIGGILLICLLINLIIYLYLKYKRKIFFDYIKNRKYTLIEKTETNIESYSKISSKLVYRKSDILFLDDEIFILTFNKPILQISKSSENFPSIFQKFVYETKLKDNDFLKIEGKFYTPIEGNFKISINLKNKNIDINSTLSN